jgi:hypothetical protein
VSLKSLLKHHPSGCQPARPTRPTSPTIVAAVSSGPNDPRASVVARPGRMPRATPPHYAALPGTSNSRFR